mmetsp:Transcript_42844/g.121085  ORF Transcript_42844/g.121085 Transcript_42844/m.121085 type:complete len:312 (-) Transcript_42844:252-1187(-)
MSMDLLILLVCFLVSSMRLIMRLIMHMVEVLPERTPVAVLVLLCEPVLHVVGHFGHREVVVPPVPRASVDRVEVVGSCEGQNRGDHDITDTRHQPHQQRACEHAQEDAARLRDPMQQERVRHGLQIVQGAGGLQDLHVAIQLHGWGVPRAGVEPDEAVPRRGLARVVAHEAAPAPATVLADGPELHRRRHGARPGRGALVRGRLRALGAHDGRGAIHHAAERQANGKRVVQDHGGFEAYYPGIHQHSGLGVPPYVAVEPPGGRRPIWPVGGVIVVDADGGRHCHAGQPDDEEPWHALMTEVEGLGCNGDLA